MFNHYKIKSQTVFYNGNVLDSLLEFRFVLMIEKTHAWLRQGFEIYYSFDKCKPCIEAELRSYRPDFLIRNWETGKAELIELKPFGFIDEYKDRKIRDTNKYIDDFQFDWNFRYLNYADIPLSKDQKHKFYSVLNEQDSWHHKPCGRLLQNNSTLNDNEYRQFVLNGLLPTSVQPFDFVASHSCTSCSLLPALIQ